ncbi:AfsR/SARP family transcriptional regulator [Actinoplanes derwentensis]|uniref:DNA-binding transcriptional activator of the SARP family n=1 Tax=Actinoplanes derwentensis TaxID=113562 RepID=A0A1H2D845_9ACTN|nr:BTAD domain-containing putative transcriptional regulator [Actinoplanes derwentensis]GID89705.1 SARP family transcriptional regulator [Actinoplanes derwentensis]SDT78891.1 DNA-binding transcriptional activator of the SARP family [Actinoplanes derwentensis]
MTVTVDPGAPPADEYRVLGPLTVILRGRPVPVTAPKQRIILAALLVRAGSWVSTAELAGAVWDDRPPPENPRGALQVHLTRLRSRFAACLPGEAGPIEARPGAYRIVVPPGSLDLDRFRDSIGRARGARRGATPDAELTWVHRALAQWRGEPLALVPSVRLQREVVTALVDERLGWTERRFELELALGRHDQIVGELRAATIAHPERDRLWGQLMDALAACDDRPAAIAVYHQARRQLRAELGVTPGPELRRRYRDLIAEAGQGPGSGTAAPATGRDRWWPQCQLPPDLTDFTGRAAVLGELCATLRPDDSPVVCITGAPGAGKSALAVRAGHRLRARFPDGQWFVRAGGRTWSDILAEMLATTGVRQPPAGTAAAVARLRREIDGRKVLLVIDDIPEGAPPPGLLPLPAGSAVLAVRRADPDAHACDFAHVVVLPVLQHAEAVELLTGMVGPARARHEPAALDTLVERCDRLPLALRIAGAHLATRPGSIAAFAARLGADPLTALTIPGSRRAAVRTTFELAYSALPRNARRLFRHLALVPRLSHRVETIAELTGMPPSAASAIVADLVRAQIVGLGPDGVIRLHSLMARYAAERVHAEDSPSDRRTAAQRLAEWYLRFADEAVRLCHPDVLRADTGGGPAVFASERAARAWLRRERRNLVAVAVHSASSGLDTLAVALTEALRGPCGAERHHADWRLAAEAALAAVDPIREPADAAVARLNLALALQGLNELGAAETHLSQAYDRFRTRGPAQLEMVAVTALAMHRLQQPTKRFDDAIELLHRGLRLCRRSGARQAEARCLLHLGMAHHGRGELRLARRCLNAAARIAERTGRCSPHTEILARLGAVCTDLGAHHEAVRRLRTALRMGRSARSAHSVALASYELGRLRRATGRPDRAHAHVARAMAVAEPAGYAAVLVNARNLLAGLHHDQGRAEDAEREYRRALGEAERIGHPGARCEALTGLTLLAHRQGRDHQVPVMAGQAVRAARATGSARWQFRVRELLAPLQSAPIGR